MDRVIKTSQELESLVSRLFEEPAIAIDTEFHGEKRYWPDLYLIQIADSRGPLAVDPLEIDDLSPLGKVLESRSPVKVMHSARNDIEILMQQLNIEFRSVFDTQLAAAFLGHNRQTSLSNLIKAECGAVAGKGHTLTDWSLRPLSNAQIEYALDDVRYLLEIYEKQVRRMTNLGRLEWYRQEAASLTDVSSYGNSLKKKFRRIRSGSKVRKKRLHLLWTLIKWREEAARSINKPRNYIARDHVIGAIASMAPRNKRSLSTLRGVSDGFVSRWGDDLISIVKEAMQNHSEEYPKIKRRHSKPGISARRDILRIFLKQESCRLGISSELLLSRDLLDALAMDPPGNEEELYAIEELSGWRKEALGNELISILSGKLALVMNSGGENGLDFVRVRD